MMMLGGDGAPPAEAVETHESGGSGSTSVPGGGAIEESERSGGGGGGNRWPRQETLALLKIRSDMDVAFRDASLKAPLWDEVSRKMAELGFQRNPKKCKEKFENVYKYHKRTKDGRSSKPDGKSYRFFDQLEALENTSPNPISFTPPPPLPPPPTATTMAVPANGTTNVTSSNTSSFSPTPLSVVHPNTQKNPINPSSSFQPMLSQLPAIHPPQMAHTFQPSPHPYNISASQLSNSTSSSSSTSSDEDIMHRRRGRKRKWKDYFERLMKEVVSKQEELQKKFLDELEKRERDRMSRDEAWRVQEMARINREHELLLHERSISAAKDAAVIAFLQKATSADDVTNNNNNNNNNQPTPEKNNPPPQPPPPPRQQPPAPPLPPPTQAVAAEQAGALVVAVTPNNGGDRSAGSSRWPKAEVEALINLRTRLDLKYLENGPKGPLWEEISAEMGKIGYKRSSKRCKEKWENINKYFKKVKESNKRRPEDSKTCPYFHQLEAIYKERAIHHNNNNHVPSFDPENPMLAIMARPEQQWPLNHEQQQHPQQQQQQQQITHDSVMHGNDNGSENNDHDEDDEEDEEEDEGGGYEIVANKQMSSVTNTAE